MGKKKNKRQRAYGEFEDEMKQIMQKNDGETQEQVSVKFNSEIEKLKQSKSRSKALFTRARHGLLSLLDEDLPSRSQLQKTRQHLSILLGKAMDIMSSLSDKYEERNDAVNIEKISREMEQIEREFADVQDKTQEYLDARKDDPSSIASNMSHKVRELQEEQREAREYAEQLEFKVVKEEEKITAEKLKIAQEYTRKLQELETRSQQGRQELLAAKEESTKRQAALEKEIDEELGLPKFEDFTDFLPPKNSSPTFHEPPLIRPKFESFTDFPQPKNSSPTKEIGQDLWKQLKRVSIPVFSGVKSTYENWKAAFVACIDNAPATPEYKLLQLRQYLSGEALKVIENLGHSATAYEAAKNRLERKYGGARRQIALNLEELENFKPIRMGNAKDLDKFADLLEVAVINLKEAGRHEELGNGSLYSKLQRKMPEQLLAQYHRWIYENRRVECVETLREWIIQEAEFQTIAAETLRGISGSAIEVPRKTRTFFGESRPQRNHQDQLKDRRRACRACEQNHPIWQCEKFKAMSVQKRWDTAKQNNLCYRCLGQNHVGRACTRSRICGLNGCKETHNRLLHEDKSEGKDQPESSKQGEGAKNDEPSTEDQRNQTKSSAVTSTEGEQPSKQERSHTTTVHKEEPNDGEYVALRTVPVVLKNGGRKLVVNALLDDASTKSYINSDVAAQLGLQGANQRVTVSVLNGHVDTFVTMPVEFGIESLDGRTSAQISAFTADRVTGNMKAVDWNNCSKKWDHLRGINFPYLGPRPIVDILIGIDHADLHYSIQDIRGNPGEPVARLTPLGWTCIGHPDPGTEQRTGYKTNFIRTYFARTGEDELNNTLRKFWEIEDVPNVVAKSLKAEDREALNTLKASMKFENGRYEVVIPWKGCKPSLPDNYEAALKRLQNTEKRLLKDKEIGKSYSAVIGQYLEKGYVTKIEKKEQEPGEVWYLPHFPIIRPDKATTKTRIVFDASAKCEGIALNDVTHQGPKMQRELFDVLLRLRQKPVALACDIAEMYLRIGLAPEDRPYHRFLWRDLDQTKAPEEYEFNRVVFGVNSSPFQSQFVVQEHAKMYKDEFPMAAETILESTYMDDSMDSTQDEREGIELYHQLSKLWEKAGMHARKWISNSEKVLEEIPIEDRASEVDLATGDLPSVKTLGVLWKAKEDVFTYKSQHLTDNNQALTKRSFLKKIATLFDPLGFLSPYTIRAKILMQELWTTGIDWDGELTADQIKKATRWFQELKDLPSVQIPRCVQPALGKLITMGLHTFTDASEEAYGAVVYTRCEYESGEVAVRMVASKSRVAPLKATSIPRLEIMGAVLGLRLSLSISKVYKIDAQILKFWTDSMNVLWWIQRPSRTFKPFVANRIGEIHSYSDPAQWRHIPTRENPADLLTRGLPLEELSDKELWWEGPAFLPLQASEWPKSEVSPDNAVEHEEKVKNTGKLLARGCPQIRTMVAVKEETPWRMEPTRFSSWLRLTRVQAWIYRFLDNCRLPRTRRTGGELTAEEITDAEVHIIKKAQRETFKDEYQALSGRKEIPRHSKLLALKPTLDEDGLLRSDGRLVNADYLPYDTRFPIILPRRNWVTKLIVKEHHERGNHRIGTNQTLSSLATRFWIMQAREEIRDWERECYSCRKSKVAPAKQIMAPLPDIRLKLPLRAFARVAVDYAGPFVTIQGRSRRRAKRYLCLFTCLTSRAVHLEIAYSMDTDAFLNAFYRMVNRRGLPLEVLSDNGSNFISGERELRELVEQLDKEKIKRSSANKGIRWHFNPPLAPHFGGVHETLIKTAKRATYGILSQADITDEELMTAFTGAEALMNSRPLTYQSAHPSDDVPLTPNHFLFGQAGGQFAPDSVDTTQFNLRNRWRRVQELVRHFWSRWLREWLPALNRRGKWWFAKKEIKVGDVVLVLKPDSPRGQWPLGRVAEVNPGKDGHVRAVKVTVGGKTFTRPIAKLCPLEVDGS